jgi:hypothetical protein
MPLYPTNRTHEFVVFLARFTMQIAALKEK